MAVGRQFGPYTLRRKLARGGMADIFLASRRSAEGETLCVIKMMLPASLRNPRALKLFLGEARLAAMLEHQNIVRILELDRVDDYYFIAMEYVPGETFFHLIHQSAQVDRPLQALEAACLVRQACRGLAYAHAMTDPEGRPLNVVHRDISPSNLMLSYQGVVKLLDFGIAAAESRRAGFTSGKAIGKYGYMSPEQCRGQQVDRRSDIFSLGVVFWELLTGTSLFPGRNPQAIAAAIVSGDTPPPSAVRSDTPPALERVVMRSLAQSPRDRFQDATQMGQAIDEALIDEPARLDHDRLAALLRARFGRRRARLARIGDVGQKIELATLLFDDLEAEPPVAAEDAAASSRRPRSVLSRPTRIVLGVSIVLLAAALAFAAWVAGLGAGATARPAGSSPAPATSGTLLIDSTPQGASIFIDGAAIGKRTPAEIAGIPLDRQVEIGLTKRGLPRWTGRVVLEEPQPRRIHAMLAAPGDTPRPDPPPRSRRGNR